MFMGLDSPGLIKAGIYAVGFLAAVFVIIAYWTIYKKAGEKGWKALIPFYNEYVFYKFAWKTKFFFILLPFTVIYAAAAIIQNYSIDYFFGNNIMIETVSMLAFVCSIAILVIRIIKLVKLSKCFGKGKLFALGLIFFEPIFVMILAFGKAQYAGTAKTQEAESIE